MLRLLIPLLLLILPACDRAEPPAAPAAKASARRILSLDIRSVVPLEPGRATSVAVDAKGNIYWVQETASQDDLVFAMGDDGVPQGTPVSSVGITSGLGARGTGNVQSLAAAGDALWFYFAGGSGPTMMCVVGRYTPSTGAIEIVVGNDQLAAVSGMGFALDIARGSLFFTDSGALWLWLRHQDEGVLLRIDPLAAPGAAGAVGKPVTLAGGTGTPDLRSNDLRVSGGDGDALLIADLRSACLWRVDATGGAKPLWDLTGMTRRFARPLWTKDGLLLFVGIGDPIVNLITPGEHLGAAVEPPPTDLPTLITLRAGEPATLVTPFAMVSRDNIAIESLDLTEIAPDPLTESWVAYDRRSGHLLRLRRIDVPG